MKLHLVASVAGTRGQAERTTAAVPGRCEVLGYALLFLIIAVFAGIFGFWAAATVFAGLARILFWLFVIGFIVMLVMHYSRRRV
jgi:uncharacterized membrane protein YtjA (UPF0391 family)